VRIKRVSFRNVGPFGSQGVTLDGFSSGLNVVCETNEFGKSTILKALEMVLFKPFSGADKTLKALRSAGSDGALEGEIIFSAEGRVYRLYKRFLKQKTARLEDAQTGEVLAVTNSGQEKKHGPLRNAREAVQSTEAELQEAQRLSALTTSYGSELEKVTADIDRLMRDVECGPTADGLHSSAYQL